MYCMKNPFSIKINDTIILRTIMNTYRKIDNIESKFKYELILPKQLKEKQEIEIYREDSNSLAKKIKADIAFIDPPYNSRQYSRFYHVLENITKWEKTELYGIALKPKEENNN